MYYNYSIPYYNNVIPYRSRQFGSFLIPFGLGLVTGPLVFNPRPRPNYYYPRPRPISKQDESVKTLSLVDTLIP